jgi:exonuclease 1
LHKIIKGPSGRELILGGPNRYRYVNDCIKRINKIQNQGVKVIMVFDGGPLPCKRGEEEYRKK